MLILRNKTRRNPSFRFAAILLLAMCFSACEREAKQETLPASIVAMMEAETNCTCEPYIDQLRWRGKTVYISSCRGPACLCAVIYYNNKGEAFQPPSGFTYDQFVREARFVRHVWICGQ